MLAASLTLNGCQLGILHGILKTQTELIAKPQYLSRTVQRLHTIHTHQYRLLATAQETI